VGTRIVASVTRRKRRENVGIGGPLKRRARKAIREA
jgi:hypothetical protein